MKRTILAVLIISGLLTAGCSTPSGTPTAAPVTSTVTATATATTTKAGPTVTETQTPAPVTKTKTKVVTQQETPAACADALDEAEAIILKSNEATGDLVDAIRFLSPVQLTSLATDKIKDGTAALKAGTAMFAQYKADRDECRAHSS